MSKKAKRKSNGGRPPSNGKEAKTYHLFTIDDGVFQEFKRHCKHNKIKMSACVEKLMHEYSVIHAME